jgi:hypothetical protein
VLLYQALGIEDVGLLGLGLRHALHTATVLGLRVFGRFLAPSTKVETWNCLSLAVIIVPYRHGGGWSKKINAWYLNTLMVYL